MSTPGFSHELEPVMGAISELSADVASIPEQIMSDLGGGISGLAETIVSGLGESLLEMPNTVLSGLIVSLPDEILSGLNDRLSGMLEAELAKALSNLGIDSLGVAVLNLLGRLDCQCGAASAAGTLNTALVSLSGVSVGLKDLSDILLGDGGLLATLGGLQDVFDRLTLMADPADPDKGLAAVMGGIPSLIANLEEMSAVANTAHTGLADLIGTTDAAAGAIGSVVSDLLSAVGTPV